MQGARQLLKMLATASGRLESIQAESILEVAAEEIFHSNESADETLLVEQETLAPKLYCRPAAEENET